MSKSSRWITAFTFSLLAHVSLLSVLSLIPGDGPDASAVPLAVELDAPAENRPAQKRKAAPPDPPRPTPAPSASAPQETPEPEPERAQAPTPDTNADTTPQLAPAIYPPSQLTHRPRFRHKVEPEYPAIERAGGAEAQVIAEAVIDPNGRVVDVRIVESAGPHFDAAVAAALRQSTFIPGSLNDEAVTVRVQIPYRFALR